MRNIKSGIYKIQNIINNKIYIGQSVDLDRRYYEHLKLLRKNKHFNQKLQNAFNKYGEHNFKFEVLENVNVKELNVKEQYYIDFYNSVDLGYNICRVAGSTLGLLNKRIICLETKQVYNGIRQAERETGFASSGLANCCKGKSNTCHSLHFMYYNDYINKDSNYIKEIMSKNFTRKVRCVDTQEVFESLTLASKRYNIQIGNLWSCLQEKFKQVGGHAWEYAD